ncbi:MAG: site-specific DNA-methyltransferase [Janthinobacterium lividum]
MTDDRAYVERRTVNAATDHIEMLKTLFPEIVTEGRVDFERLRAALGDAVDDGPERFSFTWAGKRDGIKRLQESSRATLIPAQTEGVSPETTRNVFVEGENLDVLKLIHKSYWGQVKCIYIDPPYNTGKDFIYPDNYADPMDFYLKATGQKDADGNLLTSNPETSGRFHSAWLTMMYPRLFLARQLLRDDGVILISISDREVANLRLVMNELFGEENFIAELVWEKGRKNDAKLFSVGHEYMLVYARSLASLKQMKTVWRESKPGAKDIVAEYRSLRAIHGPNNEAVQTALRQWYGSLPNNHPSKKLSRYKWVDDNGPWRDRDISWPGGGGPRYNVLHPVTGIPVKVPEAGWRFADPEKMQRQIRLGLVVFRADETEPPFRKAHLIPVPEELDDDDEAIEDDDGAEEDGAEGGAEDDTAVGLQVMGSVLYKQSQVAVKYLKRLMGAKVFDNPKDHEILARLIGYVTMPDSNDLVLDFFAGSCASAEAVLRRNREDGGNRRFIMVQLPYLTKLRDYRTISDIGKERIRRVIAEMQPDPLVLNGTSRLADEDLGFRVFRMVPSHYKQWAEPEAGEYDTYVDQVALFNDPLVPGWTPEGILWEVAIKEGYALTSRVEEVTVIPGSLVWRVTDAEKNQTFHICLDDDVPPTLPLTLSLGTGDLFVCRDAALDDQAAANLALQCRLRTI